MAEKLTVSCNCGWKHEGNDEHEVAHALMAHAKQCSGAELSHEQAHKMVQEQNKQK